MADTILLFFEILIPKSTKSANCLKQKVFASGFCSDICIAYDKTILWMKIHVISTSAGLRVEARYVVKDSGSSSLLKTVLFFPAHDC